jgi:hypothetical protein
MRRFAFASLLFLLCACHRTPAPPSAASDPATDAAVVSAAPLDPSDPAGLSRASDSGAETGPSLAVTSDGTVVIAWTSRRPGKPDVIGTRFSRDSGATWELMQTIPAPDDRAASDPVVAADRAGNVYLAWLGARAADAGTTDSHVYVARAEAGSNQFGPPFEVTDAMRHGANVSRPWLAVTGNGNVLVTWAFFSPNADGVGIASSKDGASWTRGIVIERIDLHVKLPYICTSPDGERAWVAYLDAEAGVRVRASDDGGLTWSPARVSTASTHEDRPLIAPQSPVCVGEGEDVTVAYARLRSSSDAGLGTTASSIVVARSADGGRSFDVRRSYDAGSVSIEYPQIAREGDGSVDVAFYASGATPEGGALRSVRFSADEKGSVSASKIVRDHFHFDPLGDQNMLPGTYFGWAWHDSALFAASIDNSGEGPHVVFTRTPTR